MQTWEVQKNPCILCTLEANFHERESITLPFLICFPTKKPCQFDNLQGQKSLPQVKIFVP